MLVVASCVSVEKASTLEIYLWMQILRYVKQPTGPPREVGSLGYLVMNLVKNLVTNLVMILVNR